MRITVAAALLLAVVLVLPVSSDAWWFWRRRTSCTRVNCIPRSWGKWGACTPFVPGECYQRRTRSLVRQGSCGGTTCSMVSRQRCTCPGNIRCSYVSRTEWGARTPRARSHLPTPVPYVFIHHTVTPECYTKTACKARVKTVQNGHMDDSDTRYDDIGYNWLIGGDGLVYEGRGWDLQGAQTKYYNHVSIGIAFIGNFVSRRPSAKALSAAQSLIRCGVQAGKIRTNYELFPHSRAKKTACPGSQLENIIRTWPNYSNKVIKKYN